MITQFHKQNWCWFIAWHFLSHIQIIPCFHNRTRNMRIHFRFFLFSPSEKPFRISKLYKTAYHQKLYRRIQRTNRELRAIILWRICTVHWTRNNIFDFHCKGHHQHHTSWDPPPYTWASIIDDILRDPHHLRLPFLVHKYIYFLRCSHSTSFCNIGSLVSCQCNYLRKI